MSPGCSVPRLTPAKSPSPAATEWMSTQAIGAYPDLKSTEPLLPACASLLCCQVQRTFTTSSLRIMLRTDVAEEELPPVQTAHMVSTILSLSATLSMGLPEGHRTAAAA